MRAAYVSANNAVTLFQARHCAFVEIRLAARERFRVSERLDFGEGNDVVKW
jgi:hypothetical protein